MARFCTRENEPLKRWNGIPIYLTTILTAVFVLGLFLSAILQSAQSPLLRDLIFMLPGDMSNIVGAFTYPFIGEITFFTPFAILMFYWWSVGIETHMGRHVLARLLLLLTFVPLVFMAVLWYGFGIPGAIMGNFLLSVGLLISFATLYPRVEVFGWIPFKWFAFACLVCGSMMQLAGRQWVTLTNLWLCAAAGFLYIRYRMDQEMDDAEPVWSKLRTWMRRKPKLRVLPTPSAPRSRPMTARSYGPDPAAEVDALLDKIAKSGLSSLSNSERAKLERARQELLKKEEL